MKSAYFLIPLILGACVSTEVQEEVGLIGDATAAVAERTITQLGPQIRAFEESEPERAAANGDVWKLSVGCTDTEAVFNSDSLETCQVEKLRNGASGGSPEPFQAVARKFAVLEDYSAALAELAAAGTEQEVKLAFGNATDALDGLADQTGSTRVGRIADLLGENSEKVDAVVDAGVSALRARLLRRLVTQAHPQVATIAGEIKALLRGMNIDPAYSTAYDAMVASNRAALQARLDGPAALASAYRDLEAKHAAFIAIAERSVFTQLDQLVEAHGGLRARLRQRPSGDELKAYVRALKDLKKTLEG